MIQSSADKRWMDAAARLALNARPASRPNPPVGATIVRDGHVVGRGWTAPGGRPHAEAVALELAGERARGATLYVTLEPCAHPSERGPACADLVSRSGLARVVVALADPDPRTAGKGMTRIRDAGIEVDRISMSPGDAGLAGYFSQRLTNRPHVTLKLATSVDGCIATASGESRWITGEAARAHVHSRRALSDAILVGGETWRVDRPSLDVRLAGLENRAPKRVVLSRGRIQGADHTLDHPNAITSLVGIQYLYVEGGAQAAAAFLKADLVDSLHLYRAPILLGGGRLAIGDLGLTELAEAHGRWSHVESRQLGSDSFEAYERRREG